MRIPHNGIRSPWKAADEPCDECEHFLDSTWADDSAAVTDAAHPDELLGTATRLIQIVLSCCQKHGASQSQAWQICPDCSAARTPKPSRSCLMVQLSKFVLKPPTPIWGPLWIGTASCWVKPSVYLPAQPARFVRPGPQLCRMNTCMSGTAPRSSMALLERRFFNLELWVDTDKAWQVLQDGFHRLQKRLLATRFRDAAYFHLHHAEVLYLTGLQDLHCTAVQKRLGFLAGLIRNGGPQIWSLVQWKKTWGQHIQRDLVWFRTIGALIHIPSVRLRPGQSGGTF